MIHSFRPIGVARLRALADCAAQFFGCFVAIFLTLLSLGAWMMNIGLGPSAMVCLSGALAAAGAICLTLLDSDGQ